ncbi:MAG: glycosyltransferase family 9 protein [Odoribacteraceae bacterium]|jgi:heptosyltransferase-2|nr:glycosyltransferase family 9 protein [Odoribacteraceae bacterium]
MIKRIIIPRFRRVGDSVLSVALCSSLRKTFPGASIDYVVNDNIASLFEGHPDIDNLVRFSSEDTRGTRRYVKKVWRVAREGRYDLIVDPRSTPRTLWFALFSPRARWRIGRRKRYNALLHNHRVEVRVEGKDEVERTLLLLSPLEKEFEVVYDREFKLYLSPGEREEVRRSMERQGVDFSRPVVVCAVATQLPYKAWEMDRMRQVLARIIERYDARLIFNYAGKVEEETARRLYRMMNNHPNVSIDVNAPTLRGLAAMIANADFFFGNEGGPRHISQALDVPSFAIYPPHISKSKWLPNASERFQGVHPYDISEAARDKKLSYIEKYDVVTVEEVWKRALPMLDVYLGGKAAARAAER